MHGSLGSDSGFPRTRIEDLSVSRLLIGTNWFLGFSHTSNARDLFIKERQTRKQIADVLEVFFRAGVDTIYGARPESPHLEEALKDAEDRTGRGAIRMGTPFFDLSGGPEADGHNRRVLDGFAQLGCRVCLPHQATTDQMVDRTHRRITGMEYYAALMRERGMIPGLSTHMPETVPYADESGLDVATYVQIYNAAGFLMQVEVDWVHRIIWNAAKPVITIKPLAAGRLVPLVGLAFSWATIREQDMICIGCLTPDEAREVIDISLSQLQRSGSQVKLQVTRSKKSLLE
jgi:hypothetical protein